MRQSFNAEILFTRSFFFLYVVCRSPCWEHRCCGSSKNNQTNCWQTVLCPTLEVDENGNPTGEIDDLRIQAIRKTIAAYKNQ